MTPYSFSGTIDRLEIAVGYDGLFRGAPDPVVVFGAYVTDGRSTYVLGRTLHRFVAKPPFPSNATTDAPFPPTGGVTVDARYRFVILAVALEEDGGHDVRRLYGAVEHHTKLTVWKPDAVDVDPMTLAGVAQTGTVFVPTPVDLDIDGTLAAASCSSDKFIGAVCWTMVPRPAPVMSMYRLPFLSADRKNDWTAVVTISH